MGQSYCRVISADGSGFHGVALENIVSRVKETRCFQHMSEKHVIGFILGKIALDRRKDKFTPAWAGLIDCPKCKGRGWFGRGRKPCPQCGGEKTVLHHKPAKWTKTTESNCMNELVLRASFSAWSGQWRGKRFERHGFAVHVDPMLSNGIPYAVYDALHATKNVMPNIVMKLRSLEGDESTKDEIEDWIMSVARTARRAPRIGPYERFDKIYSSMTKRDERQPIVNLGLLCQRMAKSFGVTCPITGKWVNPNDLQANRKRRDLWRDNKLPDPLGLPMVMAHIDCGAYVSAVTPEIERKLDRAIDRWWDQYETPPDETWLLAELIEKTIPQMRIAA